MRKILILLLCLIFTFSISAPRAAASGVGAGLTAAEMAGVVAVIAASLGVTFLDGQDMQKACNAFVGDVVPGSPMDVFLKACGVSDGYIYLRGEIAKTEMLAVVSAVRSFFMPGDNVSVEGSGVVFTNLGQIYTGTGIPPEDSGVLRFSLIEGPVEFQDANGNNFASITVADARVYESYPDQNYNLYKMVVQGVNNSAPFSSQSSGMPAMGDWPQPFVFFSVQNGRLCVNFAAVNNGHSPYVIQDTYVTPISWSRVSSVSGGGGQAAQDIPIFQEAGALSPDLVGGVWDKLAEDAAQQNGNVIIDTNTPSFRGGSSGLIPGAPDNNLVNPQQGALDSIGSTKTETDTSTGTQTQAQTQTGAQAVPNSATANPAISDTKAETSFNGLALTLADIFPFCIPFDVYAMITSLAAPRETPSFDVRLFYPGWVDYTYTFDFSDFDNIAAVLRTAELGAFCVGLAAATRKFIKW